MKHHTLLKTTGFAAMTGLALIFAPVADAQDRSVPPSMAEMGQDIATLNALCPTGDRSCLRSGLERLFSAAIDEMPDAAERQDLRNCVQSHVIPDLSNVLAGAQDDVRLARRSGYGTILGITGRCRPERGVTS